jgi:hypothetical protein
MSAQVKNFSFQINNSFSDELSRVKSTKPDILSGVLMIIIIHENFSLELA